MSSHLRHNAAPVSRRSPSPGRSGGSSRDTPLAAEDPAKRDQKIKDVVHGDFGVLRYRKHVVRLDRVEFKASGKLLAVGKLRPLRNELLGRD